MVYQMAIGTINVCFLDDQNRNDGSAAKPYYMSKSLRALAKSSPGSSMNQNDTSDSDKNSKKK